jgi:hypothetical protein
MGMTVSGSTAAAALTTGAPDPQGWQAWMRQDLDSSGDQPFENRLAARAGSPDQQAAFLNEYQALRSQHITAHASGLNEGSQGGTWRSVRQADSDYAGAITDLVSKYFPTLSTDPNNAERQLVEGGLYKSQDPAIYSWQGGSWAPRPTPASPAVDAHRGASSFE